MNKIPFIVKGFFFEVDESGIHGLHSQTAGGDPLAVLQQLEGCALRRVFGGKPQSALSL
ncbi:MAG: hypothetical protein WAN36_02190 [Calditrichia bacterium]